MSTDKQRSGRTTRMLDHARQLSNQGRAVYIVVDNENHARMLRRELGESHLIKVETEESLGNLDWQTMTMLGAHPNCILLVDPFAIERRFGPILEMWTRYDK